MGIVPEVIQNMKGEYTIMTTVNNIHSAEGWNALAREANTKALLGRGIEPTEQNYRLYIQSLMDMVKKTENKNPPIVAIRGN